MLPNTSQEMPKKYVRSLSRSRINRSGLSVGDVAPSFELPLMNGGFVRLEDFSGSELLLVFSDPNCGPCHELMPKLKRLHQRTPDINILVISRGKCTENVLKYNQYMHVFPIALQRHWEISIKYAMFATPIAYLIDAKGMISSKVAPGADAILTLLKGAAILALLRQETGG